MNEEILSANEELQSTTEEMEITNEELQSSNEELNTLNEEILAPERGIEPSAKRHPQPLECHECGLPLLGFIPPYPEIYLHCSKCIEFDFRGDVGRLIEDVRLGVRIPTCISGSGPQ